MNNYTIINVNKTLSSLIKLFIVISLFIPYVMKISYRNVTFILSNFIALGIILLLIVKKNSQKKHINFILLFGFILLIYNIVLSLYNIKYHHYFIEQINKNISMIFVLMIMLKIDNEFIQKYKIIKFLITCIIISVIISCVFYFLGIEAVFLENATFMLRKQGMFEGNRLTWIYGHKSTYALMLILFLSLILKFKDEFEKKYNFYACVFILIFATILTATASALVLLLLILTSYFMSRINFKRYPVLKISLVIGLLCISAIIGLGVLNLISKERNLATIGNRTYIYNAAKIYLPQYKNGIGKNFGNIYMTHELGRIENFHNIFLNEMLRFSIPVGFLYMILMLTFMIYCCKRGKLYSIVTCISCLVLFNMDYCLKTEQLSIFLFLMYFINIYDNKNKSLHRHKFDTIYQ